jgi:hypothetical protein
MFGVNFQYRYVVDGKEYLGSLYTLKATTTSKPRKGLLKKFPVGAEVTCYFDPTEPSRAVLSPGLQGEDLFLAMFCVLLDILIASFAVILVYVWWERHHDMTVRPRLVEKSGKTFRYWMGGMTPLAAFISAYIGLLILVAFVVMATSTDLPPSVQWVAGLWIAQIALSTAVAIFFYLRRKSGQQDLIFDLEAATVSLPAMRKRATREILPIATIDQFVVVPAQQEGRTRKKEWCVKLLTREHSEFVLKAVPSRAAGHRLIAALSRHKASA